ncbi:beta-sarcoglycan isoform X1 [Manis pentadactyla]|uniref:beta-sarcoglycan isoform X1 n=1 Tax=Manis pentadactyla TaxID=143292 RepID=UPI00255CCA62|nr:beta-sarcoglycan isoform X1 [Manis pentadactyla]
MGNGGHRERRPCIWWVPFQRLQRRPRGRGVHVRGKRAPRTPSRVPIGRTGARSRAGCESIPGGVGGRERRGPPPTSPGRRRRSAGCGRGGKGGEAGHAKMAAAAAVAAAEQQSSNGPVKKSMREKAVERRNINKEHNSNFKAGYIPIDEDRLHKTGLRGRKGNLAICVIILLFILAVINLIITLVIWAVIRIGPNGCDSMEFHESGLLRFKQVSDMGVIHPLYKSTVGGRQNENLVITGNNQPIVFQQGTTKLSVEKNKTSITSDIGMQFFDPRTQNILFSTDYETHEFHLPSGVKSLNVQKASTERITSNATSDLNIKVDGRAIVRGNEGVFIMGKTIEFHMGGNMELKAENSIILNGTVMVSTTRLPSSSSGDQFGPGDWVRYKLCVCADGTLFKVQVTGQNMGCQISDNPCGNTH